jgi:hypothetical protein
LKLHYLFAQSISNSLVSTITYQPEYTFISFHPNIVMAKGKQGRMTLPKKGVNTSKKRTSESITPGDESAFVPNRKDKRVTTRDDVDVLGNPPSSAFASLPGGSRTHIDSKYGSNVPSAAKGPRLNKVSTAAAMPPPTQVFQTHCAEDDSSISLGDHSETLTLALAIHKENVDLQFKNRESLKDMTIMTLQNTNRQLLAIKEQAEQFALWNKEICKIVGKIFHISKFADLDVSKHYILMLLLTYIHFTHNAYFVTPIGSQ